MTRGGLIMSALALSAWLWLFGPVDSDVLVGQVPAEMSAGRGEAPAAVAPASGSVATTQAPVRAEVTSVLPIVASPATAAGSSLLPTAQSPAAQPQAASPGPVVPVAPPREAAAREAAAPARNATGTPRAVPPAPARALVLPPAIPPDAPEPPTTVASDPAPLVPPPAPSPGSLPATTTQSSVPVATPVDPTLMIPVGSPQGGTSLAPRSGAPERDRRNSFRHVRPTARLAAAQCPVPGASQASRAKFMRCEQALAQALRARGVGESDLRTVAVALSTPDQRVEIVGLMAPIATR